MKKYQKQIERLQKELTEIKERYRLFMEMCPDAVVTVCDGKFASVNKAGLKLYGVKNAKGLIGKNALDFLHPDYHGVAHERIKQLKQGKPVPALEEKLVLADGKVVDIEAVATPVTLNGKQGIEAIVRDITDRKKAQKLLEEKNIALRELLSQIEHRKISMREQIMFNLDTLIRPYLKELKKKSTKIEQKQITFIEDSLQKMVESFGPTLHRNIEKFSPKEVLICNMIRKNLPNKEIARLLKISPLTVGTHRNRIRKKLGLTRASNLTVYLQKN